MSIICGAAYGGHEIICRLAKICGAKKFDNMLCNAARYGHENICRLAKEWGADPYAMLYGVYLGK